MAEPIDPGIVKMLEYRPVDATKTETGPGPYRPEVLIPGHKPYVAGREFTMFGDAVNWARGFVQRPGTFIKPGTVVMIGDKVLAVLATPAGTARLQFLGARRGPRAK